MSVHRVFVGMSAATLALGLALPAQAGNSYFMSDLDFSATDPGQNFILRGSIGAASITAHEHVYAGGSGNENLSELIWQSTAPTANIDLKVRLPGDWTLRGTVSAALFGSSSMSDYDWTGFSPSYDFDDWDHRSISPNTSLDWYLNGSLAFGRDLPVNDVLTVNVNGGVQYTDVEWTATGGTYIYSTSGFRDTTGSLPDNTPAGRYRQQLPTVFAGIDGIVDDGPWSLEMGAKAGLVVMGQSVDHHYLRVPPEYIVDQLSYGQMLSADAKLDYNITDHLGLFLEGSYQKLFASHTPSDYYQTSNNALLIHSDNIGGAELDAAALTAGIKGNF